MSLTLNEVEFLVRLAVGCDDTEGGRAVYRYVTPLTVEEAMSQMTLFKLALDDMIEVDVDRSDHICYFLLTKKGLLTGRSYARTDRAGWRSMGIGEFGGYDD